MKPNWIMVIINFAIAALVGYGFYAGNSADANKWLLTVGSGLCVFLTLTGAFGIQSSGGVVVNGAALSVVFFIIFIISHIIFSLVPVVFAPYIIINGILLLVYVIVFYAITKAA